DTFTDDNGTTIQNHTADGVNWTATHEMVANKATIQDNQVQIDAYRESYFVSDSSEDYSQITHLVTNQMPNQANQGIQGKTHNHVVLHFLVYQKELYNIEHTYYLLTDSLQS
ncbi:unnamed protein product, partial [marine sediment metagenome]